MPDTAFTKQTLKCERCEKIIPEKRWLIQDIEYLGEGSPRMPICEECHESFLHWLYEIKKFKEKFDEKHGKPSEH